MTRTRSIAALASMAILLPATVALAQETKSPPPSAPSTSPASAAASAPNPVYKPPLRGAPGGRNVESPAPIASSMRPCFQQTSTCEPEGPLLRSASDCRATDKMPD